MSNRFDNKKILVVLAILTALLALTILVKVPGEKATIKELLVEIDTSLVDRIIIHPPLEKDKQFEFARKNSGWSIRQDRISAVPEKGAVGNILAEIMGIKPKSLEAVDKTKWKEFNLTDSLGTRVELLDKRGKSMADIMIGRFAYNQMSNPYTARNANDIQGTTFVRLYNEKKVYGVDGFLAFTFSGNFNDYRDKSLIRLNKEDITRVSFRLPGDSSFVLAKKDSVWYTGDMKADSMKVADYLDELMYMNGDTINDGFRPSSNPVCEMSIEGNNLLNISVKCYRNDNGNDYILNSSHNPETWFSSSNSGLYDRLFKSKEYFLKETVQRKK